MTLAIATIAMSHSGEAMFFAFMLLVVFLLGLGAVNLAAPLVLWKADGARSLLAPMSLLVVAIIAIAIVSIGSRWALVGTAASPDTFLRGAKQAELERLSEQLLAGHANDSVGVALEAIGFERTRVDTLERTVTLGHYRLRTWHEYVYAPNGVTRAHSTGTDSTSPRQLKEHWYYRSW